MHIFYLYTTIAQTLTKPFKIPQQKGAKNNPIPQTTKIDRSQNIPCFQKKGRIVFKLHLNWEIRYLIMW